jgi:hypothetical protein
MFSLELTPTIEFTAFTVLKNIRVGMLIIINCLANSIFSSILIFQIDVLDFIGQFLNHGGQHLTGAAQVAQKSTSTAL